MGRFYYGDIEGKFWFGIQESSDADNFGVEGTLCEEDGYISYVFETHDIPSIEEEIDACLFVIGDRKEKLDKIFAETISYSYEMIMEEFQLEDVDSAKDLLAYYARLDLGNRILECVKANGVCSFEAEI